jgi:hypothetical protein
MRQMSVCQMTNGRVSQVVGWVFPPPQYSWRLLFYQYLCVRISFFFFKQFFGQLSFGWLPFVRLSWHRTLQVGMVISNRTPDLVHPHWGQPLQPGGNLKKNFFPSLLMMRPIKLEHLSLETLTSQILDFEGKARANPIGAHFRCFLLG